VVAGAPGAWVDDCDIPEGTLFLLAPDFTYDIDLNAWFCSAEMVLAAPNTQSGYARDLAAFNSR
jgi:hypothetical protein